MKAIQRMTCNRCCVGYRVQDKPARSAVYRCPDCDLRFWETMPQTGKQPLRLGVTPEDKAEWMGEAPR